MKNLEQSNLSRSQIETIQNSGVLPADLDDFNKDASEGWTKNQTNLNILKRLDKKYASKSESTLYLIIITFNILLFFVLYFMNGFSKQENTFSTSIYQKKTQIVEKTDIEIPAKIESLQIVSSNKRIEIKEIKTNFSIQKKITEDSPNQKNKIDENYQKIALPIQKVEELQIEKTLSLKKNKKGAEIYLNNLLLLDYRKYRSRQKIETERLIISGTPANQESQHQKIESLNEWEKIDIPYIDYLDKTTNLFSKGKYKKSLTRYLEILKTYPDDLNSFFYGGLCYYNLGDYKNAIVFFQKSSTHEFSNFSEDSNWYLAKTYLAQNELNKAILILNEILKESGYYATQAQTLLLKLNK
jgi:hypothetical protein